MWYEYQMADAGRSKVTIRFNPDIIGRCCQYILELPPKDELAINAAYKDRTPVSSLLQDPDHMKDILRVTLDKIRSYEGKNLTLIDLTEILDMTGMLSLDAMCFEVPVLGPSRSNMKSVTKFLLEHLPKAKAVYDDSRMVKFRKEEGPLGLDTNDGDKPLVGETKRVVERLEKTVENGLVTFYDSNRFYTLPDFPLEFSLWEFSVLRWRWNVMYGGGSWPQGLLDYLEGQL